MANRYLTVPAGNEDGDLTGAALHTSTALAGLTNGTPYRAYRLSAASEAFTPVATGVWRGVGTHIGLPVQATGGAGTRAAGHRHFVHFPTPVQYIRLLVPTFYVQAPASGEIDVPNPMRIQCGIDPDAVQSMTVPERLPVTFDGLDVVEYDPETGPFAFAESDVIDLGEPKSVISIFTVQEWSGAIVANTMPRNTVFKTPGKQDRYERQQIRADPGSLIAEGWARTVTSLGGETAAAAPGFVPYVLGLLPGGTRCVGIVGSSTAEGTGETNGGTEEFNDAFGDGFGNRGWPARWIHQALGLPMVRFGKGADRLQYWAATPANTARRRALMARLNPTHILLQLGPNDVITGMSAMLANAQTTVDLLKDTIAGVKIVPATLPARATSSNSYLAADGSDQTVGTNWGPSSTADQWNRDYVRALAGPFADSTNFIDLYKAVALDPDGNGFLWHSDGSTPNLMTVDGTHQSGFASQRTVEILDDDPFT